MEHMVGGPSTPVQPVNPQPPHLRVYVPCDSDLFHLDTRIQHLLNRTWRRGRGLGSRALCGQRSVGAPETAGKRAQVNMWPRSPVLIQTGPSEWPVLWMRTEAHPMDVPSLSPLSFDGIFSWVLITPWPCYSPPWNEKLGNKPLLGQQASCL